jgi:hypothetical protein
LPGRRAVRKVFLLEIHAAVTETDHGSATGHRSAEGRTQEAADAGEDPPPQVDPPTPVDAVTLRRFSAGVERHWQQEWGRGPGPYLPDEQPE